MNFLNFQDLRDVLKEIVKKNILITSFKTDEQLKLILQLIYASTKMSDMFYLIRLICEESRKIKLNAT